MARHRKPQYWNEHVVARHGLELRGLGHTELKHQRGLKGSTIGPASEGRRLTAQERAAIEAQMRERGEL